MLHRVRRCKAYHRIRLHARLWRHENNLPLHNSKVEMTLFGTPKRLCGIRAIFMHTNCVGCNCLLYSCLQHPFSGNYVDSFRYSQSTFHKFDTNICDIITQVHQIDIRIFGYTCNVDCKVSEVFQVREKML